MKKPGEYLDMDVLARGAKIPDDTPQAMDVSFVSPTQTIFPYQNPMQTIVQPIPQVDIKAQDSYEAPEEYIFWEEKRDYEIHVTIAKKSQNNGAESNRVSYKAKSKRSDICLTKFLIDQIKKEVIEGLDEDTVQFIIQCRYYDDSKRQEQDLEITIDEETLNGDNLVQAIKNEFGSIHTPFPPKKNKERSSLLSKYIIDKFHETPNEEYFSPCPLPNDLSDLSDPERKSIVKLFHKIYQDANCEMELLLSVGFGAICHDKIALLKNKTAAPAIARTVIIYGCNNHEHQSNAVALTCASSDIVQVMKLSEIKVTSKQDELKQIFFVHQYEPVFFVDDEISDYSKRQNLAKVQRITEYVSNGIHRGEKADIHCSAVVFTNRKLSEFETISGNCIFINAADIPVQDYSPVDIQIIVTNFLSLLFENTDYYFKNKSGYIQHILQKIIGTNMAFQNATALCEIYRFVVKSMFANYGIGNNEVDRVLGRCMKKSTKSISAFLNENSLLLSHNTIADTFANRINTLIQSDKLQIKLYDKSLAAVKQALLYEHMGEPVLLFSNKYFESLFASPVVDEKAFREILNEYGYVISNYSEKCNYRMPIDDRKLYVAVKVSVLNKQSLEKLPDLHPVFIPNLNDGIDRIYLANDEHGNPIYWPVGKIENRSVLVQGNTRMGKTYFVTTKLIMGLHRLGYRVVVIDSAASSYSHYELGKCGFDESFISENFYHGTTCEARGIIHEFQNESDKIYIVNNETNDTEKEVLCDLLFKYQQSEFNANLNNTRPLFIVFEEAGDSTLYDAPELKRIYNQGSKLRLSVITILQMFVGEGSQRFRRMVGQASLKISFKCSTDHIRYLTEVIPPETRNLAKSRLPMFSVGEFIICGDFENPDGSLYSGGVIASTNQCYVTDSKK